MTQILTCWTGVNPQINIIHGYAEKVISDAKSRLIEMEETDLKSQLFEANEENDINTVMEIEMELEGTTLMNSHCSIEVDQVELDKLLKHVFKKTRFGI